MSTKKINDLILADTLDNSMQLETDIGGITINKINLAQLKAYVTPGAADVESDFTPTNYTAMNSSVQGNLQGIDNKLGDVNISLTNLDNELTVLQSDIIDKEDDIIIIDTTLSSSNNIPADYTATNYTAASTTVKGHLQGINSAFGTINTTLSSSNNIPSDYTATNYTAVSSSIKGHLQGINNGFGTINTTLSSSNNIPADYAAPSKYIPTSSSIKGHLEGINAVLPTGGSRTYLFTTVTLSFGTVASKRANVQTTTLTGAIVGDVVVATPTTAASDCMFMAWVSSVDTVSIRCFNPTVDPIIVGQELKICIIR